MKKLLIILLLPITLSLYSYSSNSVISQNFLPSENKEKVKLENSLADGIYFLYKKCNLDNKKCHELKPMGANGIYFLDGNQEPYEERMYLYIKNNVGIIYSLIYYDEEMVPTIVWSKLVKDETAPFTYLINENNTVSGIEPDMSINNFDFSNLEETNRIKIGDSPQGNIYVLNQKISFYFEKNGDFSINCEKYLNSLKELNKDKTSVFGGIFEMSCDSDSFFRNTAQYGEKRKVYFKKIN